MAIGMVTRVAYRLIANMWARRLRRAGVVQAVKPMTNAGDANLNCMAIARKRHGWCDDCHGVVDEMLEIVRLVAINDPGAEGSVVQRARRLIERGLPVNLARCGHHGVAIKERALRP
jgi:hypothetical protein